MATGCLRRRKVHYQWDVCEEEETFNGDGMSEMKKSPVAMGCLQGRVVTGSLRGRKAQWQWGEKSNGNGMSARKKNPVAMGSEVQWKWEDCEDIFSSVDDGKKTPVAMG